MGVLSDQSLFDIAQNIVVFCPEEAEDFQSYRTAAQLGDELRRYGQTAVRSVGRQEAGFPTIGLCTTWFILTLEIYKYLKEVDGNANQLEEQVLGQRILRAFNRMLEKPENFGILSAKITALVITTITAAQQ